MITDPAVAAEWAAAVRALGLYPAAQPSDEEFLALMARVSPEARDQVTLQLLHASREAARCFVEDHRGRIERAECESRARAVTKGKGKAW